MPDPYAITVDAFTVSWTVLNSYAFSPFGLVGRCLQKIVQDEVEGILLAPYWRYGDLSLKSS